jgi:phenylacetate-CoA ligase
MDTSHFFTSDTRRRMIETLERVEGAKVTDALRELSGTEKFTTRELDDYRWRKLTRLIDHAYKNVPYYRRAFDEAGVKPRDIRTVDDYERIPILTKKLIRENAQDMRAASLPAGMRVIEAQTGGTTGEPMKFLRDSDCNSFSRAALLRSYMWTGYRIGSSMLFLTGGSLLGAPQKLKQRAGFAAMNYHFAPGFRLSADTLMEYVNLVRRKQVKFLRGYSTLLHQFAELCEDAGIDDLELTAVYPTAEMLTSAQRETIARVFHAEVFDQYGCAEVNTLANECPEEKNLHIIEEHAWIEQVDLSTEGFGADALVVTDMDNFAQPFIRYAIGDRGRISGKMCACGRNLRYLEEFLGRSSDEIVLASGAGYPGVFFHHLFGHFPGVTQFQIIQDTPGELNVRIIRNSRFGPDDEGEIKRLVAEHTGIISTIEFVDQIERNPSGKITSVICRARADK